MKIAQKDIQGPVMFWTIVTTLFAWLPLVRIIARPEGYQWGILGLSGEGTQGPYWFFILLTIYVLALLYTANRGPRAAFHPMLILWHLAVTAAVVAGVIVSGSEAVWQGQGLHWTIPLWLLAVPCLLATTLAVIWAVTDFRRGETPAKAVWTRANSKKLAISLLLLVVAMALFRAGTNYNWVTAAAIITTIFHWILLAESFQKIQPHASTT